MVYPRRSAFVGGCLPVCLSKAEYSLRFNEPGRGVAGDEGVQDAGGRPTNLVIDPNNRLATSFTG
jgi:hypothetical protein